MRHAEPGVRESGRLVELVYELLDAHDDTSKLAEQSADEESWAAHMDYLRRLQRVGRETLAQLVA